MSGRITDRYVITGELVAETPIHVGGMDGSHSDADMPLAEDSQGRFYVPGTSLAGPMRHWLIDVFGEHEIKPLWGWIPDKGSDKAGQASRVYIDDAVIDPKWIPEVRDGVGIDREFGTAADGIKFDRQILPRGTRIPLSMTVEAIPGSRELELVAALILAMERGEVRLGGAKSRGLGRVTLKVSEKRHRRLGTRDGVLAALKGVHTFAEAWPSFGQGAVPRRETLSIKIDWKPVGPVMVKASTQGTEIDVLPLLSADENGDLSPVLPGSSLKGIIRAHCTRLLATIKGIDAATADENDRGRFLRQMAQHPELEALFGTVKKQTARANGNSEAPSVQTTGLAPLSIDDVFCATKLSREDWAKLADTMPKAGETGKNGWDIATHVGIDRWTGGAAKGFLYTAVEPWGLTWAPIVIDIDVERLRRTGPEASVALALLLIALDDLAKGRIPIGTAVNRGYGDIDVQCVAIKHHAGFAKGEHRSWDLASALDGVALGSKTNLANVTPTALRTAWVKFCSEPTRIMA